MMRAHRLLVSVSKKRVELRNLTKEEDITAVVGGTLREDALSSPPSLLLSSQPGADPNSIADGLYWDLSNDYLMKATTMTAKKATDIRPPPVPSLGGGRMPRVRGGPPPRKRLKPHPKILHFSIQPRDETGAARSARFS